MTASPEINLPEEKKIAVPKPLWDVTLDSEEVQQTRDAFFEEVKKSFESPQLSPGMIDANFFVRRREWPPQEGNRESDISDELIIRHGQPVATAVQTIEDMQYVVRFAVYPVNRLGKRALAALERADEAASRIFFQS